MANPNPTIVVASLDDSALRTSIDKLVKYVGDNAASMARSIDGSVNEMVNSFKKLNNIDSTKNLSGKSKKDIKDTVMSYDQLVGAVQYAQREVKKFSNYKTFTSEDIEKYQQALERVNALMVELNTRSKEYAASQALSAVNSSQGVLDVKQWVGNLTAQNHVLADMKKYYGNLEQESNAQLKTAELEKQKKEQENTVLALREQINLEKQKRDLMKLGTPELLKQNSVIANLEARLKQELKTQEKINEEVRKHNIETAKSDKKLALSLPENTLDQMEDKLHRIDTLVKNLKGKGILDEAEINRLINKSEILRDKIDKIKGEGAYAPKTAKDVLGMPEKTLDDITRKLQAIKEVQQGLDINKQRGQINLLNNEAERLSKLQTDILGKNTKLTTSNRALASAIGYIRNRMIYALTLGATTNFVKQVYEIRSQYELLERSLGVLVNSFQKGSQIFAELNAMALKSPFTLLELGTAAKQLTAYNFAAEEVVDVTRRLGDISAALGVPMERLTYNLGQIRAQTVLTARDARDFANAGLPIVKSLSDYYTELEGKVVTTGDVYSRMSKKLVSYNDVMAVMYKMTDRGGKFFDFQAKQAETLRVQMANLTLAFNNMLNEIGESHQSLLSAPISALKALLQNWKSIERVLNAIIVAFGIYKGVQMATVLASNAWNRSLAWQLVLGKNLTSILKTLITSLKALALNPFTYISTAISACVYLLLQWIDANKEISEINAEITKNVQENQEALQSYLNTLSKTNTIQKAIADELSQEESAKAWATMVEEIQNATYSAQTILPILMQIDDVNKRIATGKEYLQNIEKAQSLLSNIKDDTFQISHTGILGKGLADDLEDYAKAIENLNGSYNRQNKLAQAIEDAREEIDVTAESIVKFLSTNNVTDPFQISEILGTVKATIKQKVPELQGEAEKLFDVVLDERLAEYTKGAYDKNTTLWEIFMNDLKRYSSAAFVGLTEDIYKSDYQINELQKKAIEENLERFKKTMPDYYNAVAEMVSDASKLNIQIGIKFGVEQKSDFQKEFEKRINDNIGLMTTIWGRETLMDYAPKSQDNLVSWLADLEKQYKKLADDIKVYEKAGGDFAESQAKILKREYDIIGSIIDAFKMDDAQTDFQKDFESRFGAASNDLMKFAPKKEDDLDKYLSDKEKRITELDKLIKLYTSAGGDYYKNLAKQAEIERAQIQLIVDEYKGLNDFQEDFSKRIGDNSELMAFAPKAEEEFSSWVDRLQDDAQKIKKTLEELGEEGKKDPFVETVISTMEERLKQIEQVLGLYHQPIEKEKQKRTTSSSQKDELGEALKQEISLIKDMQSNYEKLRKAGVGDFEAIELAAKGYEATLERVNLVLSKYGIDKFNANQFAGKNVKELLEFLVKQREILAQNPKVKTSAIEALDVEIQKLQVDAKTYDFKKITDGLNNELAKIDEQYELAVELQANADLGNQLIDMFGIDTTDFPKSIDDLVSRYQSAVWDVIAKAKPDVDLSQYDILDVDFSKLFSDKDIGSDFMKGLLDTQKNIRQQTKKWAQDVYNQTKQLEYNLADTNGKIALKEKEISELRDKYANEQNAKQKELYALQIKEQENVLAELKEGILQMMPAYEALFGGIANHSAALTRTLAKRLKSAYEQAKEGGKNEKGEYTYIDPKSGEYVTLTEHKLGIEIDKVNKKLLESQPLWQKLKEDFTKGADDEVDFAQGLMDIADEMEKVADGINEIGNIAEGLGADEETLEIINDIGASIDGVATAAKGIAQIQSGDVIGGTVNVIKGAWGAISSWFDNSNKRITREVERSERTVRQLELAYKDLEYQVEKSMGTAETAARRATIANKQQQLEELKRQLALEESRKKKNQDEEKQLQLKGEILDLEHEIQDMTEEVVSNLTGSDIKSAAEDFVDTWVEAWRAGETTLDAINDKMDEMILNLIKKAATSAIVEKILTPLYQKIEDYTDGWSESGYGFSDNELIALANLAGQLGIQINDALGVFYGNLENLDIITKNMEAGDKQLSSLQQGIQGVSEQTANALEGYMNGLSQQAYLRNDLLMQIRDALTLTDNDMAMGVQAQILLQLQQSYQVNMAIQAILQGWSNANGMAMRVELI